MAFAPWSTGQVASPIEIEFELEPDDGDDHAPRRHTSHRHRTGGDDSRTPMRDSGSEPVRTRRRRGWSVAAGATVAVVVGTVLAGNGNLDRPAATGPTAPAAPTSAATTLVSTVPSAFATGPGSTARARGSVIGPSTVAPTIGPFAVADPARPPVVRFGGPLLIGPTGLRFVAALSDGNLADIDVDRGVVRIVPAPATSAADPALTPTTGSGDSGPTIVAGPTWAVVHPAATDGGYLVGPDGSTRPLTGILAGATVGLYPSDGPDDLWVAIDLGKKSAAFIQLVDLAGISRGASLPTNGVVPIGPDGSGGVLVTTTGGVYRASRDGYHLLTTGGVLAGSASQFVSVECDDVLACHRDLVDRSTGDHRPLGPVPPGPTTPTLGAIAQDGSKVATRTANAAGIDVLTVTTGLVTPIDASPRSLSPAEAGPVAWSADGRFLVYLDRHSDELTVFDTETETDAPLVPGLPTVRAFAVRPGP